MQLEIIISGVFHAVAILHLTRPAIKALQVSRPDDWRVQLGLMAVGPDRKSLLPGFLETGGYTPRVNTLRQGMHLQAKHFGIETMADGCTEVPDQIDSRQTSFPLLPLLTGFGPEDLLGVFQMQTDAAMSYQWDAPSSLDCDMIQMQLEEFRHLLNVKERFDLIRSVTYASSPPDRRRLTSLGQPRMLKHIFHVPKKL